jgi:aryl-alcohol dehydrogenase-like predicted oxidoreductase
VEQRSIGNDTIGRVSVGAIGLGAMPLSTKEPRPSPSDAEAVVHAALDAGVTLIDTADAYSRDEAEFGHNEELVANALRSYGRVDVLVATKGGHTRSGRDWGLDGSPSYLRRRYPSGAERPAAAPTQREVFLLSLDDTAVEATAIGASGRVGGHNCSLD